MKANELRIGNIYHGDVTDIENPQVITGSDIVDLETDPIDDYFKPILLTEEWLLRFGFNRIESRMLFDLVLVEGSALRVVLDNGNNWALVNIEQNGTISNPNENMLVGNSLIPSIPKYVHQLQNLYFSLTGSELTIN